MHVAELRTMALVEYQHHILLQAIDVLGSLQQVAQFLDGGDDDTAVRVVQLTQQDDGIGIAVGCILLEVVVLLHRLIVKVFSVHHKQHFIYHRQLGCQLCRLERCQCLTAARSVPNVPSCPACALQSAVMGVLYLQQDAFGSGYLIRTHHHQVLVDGKHAVFGQDIEQGFFGQEGLGKVLQIVDDVVFGICPIACKLKRVALCLHPSLLLVCFLHMGIAGGVAVIFGKGAVADDEQLHIIEQAIVRPKRLPAVTVDLVECFLDIDPTTLQLYMHQGQTVHQDGHIVAVLGCATGGGVLVEHLHSVVVNVPLVNKADVLCLAIVQEDIYDRVTLDAFGLVFDVEIFIGYLLRKQAFPFGIAQADVIQLLQLHTEVLH